MTSTEPAGSAWLCSLKCLYPQQGTHREFGEEVIRARVEMASSSIEYIIEATI